ncbi:MAG: ATP-binding protein [Pseudomonadota bacterium]|nr:ATP-binding protein [Pseudomonadota bacterium]
MAEISSIAQRLLQFSPDAMLVVDAWGIIQFSNETSSSLFGYRPDQLIGQPIKLLIPERFHTRHGAHVSSFLREPTSREMGARISDLFARRADGSEFPAGIRLSPFSDGGHSFVAAAIRDMTERRSISDALVAAREEADRANRAKSRFLATASHDLRQPLQAIRLMNASMQKLTRNAPDLSEIVRHQEAAIDGATRLLNALLDISRLESGAIDPQLSPVSLTVAFEDLAQEFAAAAAAKNLRLEFSDTQVVMSTDRTLFTQLLQNLIGNALKYTAQGYVRISEAAEPDALVLKIEDSGAGIPSDKVERIFDEYYQIGPQGAQRLGVGLGLAIVREVSRLLGYSVSVASTLGEGTCISVRIPRHRLLLATQAPAREDGGVTVTNGLTRGRLILLEDNDSVRIATELFLTLEGFEMRTAGTVADAQALLLDMQPGDVFITDYHLDGQLTGLDVLQRLRSQQGRDVPAILLSGDLQSMMRVVKTSIPHCRFLSKPVDTKALLAAIAELSTK